MKWAWQTRWIWIQLSCPTYNFALWPIWIRLFIGNSANLRTNQLSSSLLVNWISRNSLNRWNHIIVRRMYALMSHEVHIGACACDIVQICKSVCVPNICVSNETLYPIYYIQPSIICSTLLILFPLLIQLNGLWIIVEGQENMSIYLRTSLNVCIYTSTLPVCVCLTNNLQCCFRRWY